MRKYPPGAADVLEALRRWLNTERKASWFEQLVPGEYRFKIALFDQKAIERAAKELLVQTDGASFKSYSENSVTWLLDKRDWDINESVVVPGTIASNDGSIVILGDAHGKTLATIPYQPPVFSFKKKLPATPTPVDAKVSRTGKQAVLLDYENRI